MHERVDVYARGGGGGSDDGRCHDSGSTSGGVEGGIEEGGAGE